MSQIRRESIFLQTAYARRTRLQSLFSRMITLKNVPIVLIFGKQNVGKTTLIRLIIPRLKQRGYRVGTIKYNVPSFEIDYEGKDTYQYYQAGADVVSISSPTKLATVRRAGSIQLSIENIVANDYQDMDIVLVEGYKKWNYPSIELHSDRNFVNQTNEKYENHLNIISKTKSDSPIPAFSKGDLESIIEFLESKMRHL